MGTKPTLNRIRVGRLARDYRRRKTKKNPDHGASVAFGFHAPISAVAWTL